MADLNDFDLPVMTSLYADVIDTLRENIKRVKAGALPNEGGTIQGDLVVDGGIAAGGKVLAKGVESTDPIIIKADAGGDGVLRFTDEAGVTQGELKWKRGSDTLDLSGTLPVTINGAVPFTSANFNPGNYIPLTQKGAPNGVATLDAKGVIPPAQDSPDDAIAMAIALG